MKEPSVTNTHFPYISVIVKIQNREAKVEALLDTGFDGDLILPSHIVTNGGPPDSYLRWNLADGSTILAPTYQGTIYVNGLEDIKKREALVSILGNEPIIGRAFMNNFHIVLDHGERIIVTA